MRDSNAMIDNTREAAVTADGSPPATITEEQRHDV